jgi:hypothetical protein
VPWVNRTNEFIERRRGAVPLKREQRHWAI